MDQSNTPHDSDLPKKRVYQESGKFRGQQKWSKKTLDYYPNIKSQHLPTTQHWHHRHIWPFCLYLPVFFNKQGLVLEWYSSFDLCICTELWTPNKAVFFPTNIYKVNFKTPNYLNKIKKTSTCTFMWNIYYSSFCNKQKIIHT